MNIAQSASPTSPYSTGYPISADLTREEKTRQVIGGILPTSLGLGLQAYAGELGGLSAASTGSLGAAGATGTAAAAGSTLATVGWGATILGGVVGLTNLAMNWGRSTPTMGASSGAAVGASIGTMIAPGLGTAVGAAIGAIAGGLIGSIKTGKHKDQVQRDRVREVLIQNNIIDKDYKLTLADGSQYDVGLDGSKRAELGGRRPYEIDWTHPMTKYAVSWLNPLMDLFSGGNQKIKIDFIGYFANAALTNAKSLDDVKNNVNLIFNKFGVSDEALYKTIVSAAESGALGRDVAVAYINGIKERRDPQFAGNLAEQAPAPSQAPAL